MAKNFNMAAFVAMVAAALVMNSVVVAAATTYNVGDGLGWTVPPGGSVAYTTWAANKTFSVGDILVFTFASGSHDVAHVTKEAFEACNATSPISLETNSPANITLSSTGEQYYICTFSGHCDGGQKLSVNVTAASSPAPQPSTPSPSSAPTLAPEPSSSTTTPAPTPTPTPSSSTTPPSGNPPSPAAPTPDSTTTTPPPAPTPDTTTTTPSTPPPTPSAATSLGVAGLSATFLSIAFAFLY